MQVLCNPIIASRELRPPRGTKFASDLNALHAAAAGALQTAGLSAAELSHTVALIQYLYLLQAPVSPQKCKNPSSELGSTWAEDKTASRKRTTDKGISA